jgi:hypothetical protein
LIPWPRSKIWRVNPQHVSCYYYFCLMHFWSLNWKKIVSSFCYQCFIFSTLNKKDLFLLFNLKKKLGMLLLSQSHVHVLVIFFSKKCISYKKQFSCALLSYNYMKNNIWDKKNFLSPVTCMTWIISLVG